MSTALSPTTADDVLAAVRAAAAEASPLEIVGGGTKRGWGRPVKSNRILDLSGLSGVTLYEPDELVLSARAGTPLAEIEALVAGHRQMLAFEPPDWAPLFATAGGSGGRQTIGGILACNMAGPRRIKAGAARDFLLGFHAVNGLGEAFKSGGRVVKNVTGYDLSKLICGSFGTLAVMTDITIKVLPAPEKTRTVLVYGLDEAAAIAAMAEAMNSQHEVSAAAHLPAAIAARAAVDYVRDAGKPVTALRVEGHGPSVEHRCGALRDLLKRHGATEELHSLRAVRLWREIRDVVPLLPDPARDLWRLSVPPSGGPAVAAAIRARLDAEMVFDWAGGLIWIAVPPDAPAAAAALIRNAVAPGGGQATLMRASAQSREAVPPFQPEAAAVAALSQRVREAFDPNKILNPSRISL